MAKDPVRLIDALRVEPGSKVRLRDRDPRETFGRTKDTAVAELDAMQSRLAGLQERFWAEGRHRLLVVLQGIDTAGKGGTIEHVMGAFPPQGVRVTGFGVPSAQDLAHDYLWHVPANGQIAIFDRSHYEDVLVVRVKELVPKARWSRRYAHINAFERMLVDEGTTIVKCLLHISKEEQRERLQARLDDPTKRWKFRMGDLAERARWDDYQAAFDDMLRKTSTTRAPWYVIPADRKWFRNVAVSEILMDVLERLDPQHPPVADDVPPDLVIE